MQIGPRLLRQDPLYQRAEQLMAERQVPLEDHLLMRENLASSLAQLELGAPPERWQAKIDRDLQHPYEDARVFQKLHQLEAGCKQLAQGSFPMGKWYVSGSICKGRFGANSDVDLTCDAAFRPGQIELLNALGDWRAGAFKPDFQSGDPGLIYGSVHSDQDVSAVLVSGPLLERKLSEYDSVVPLEVSKVESEHGFLADLFVQALRKKGYQLTEGAIQAPEFSPQHSLEKVWTRAKG